MGFFSFSPFHSCKQVHFNQLYSLELWNISTKTNKFGIARSFVCTHTHTRAHRHTHIFMHFYDCLIRIGCRMYSQWRPVQCWLQTMTYQSTKYTTLFTVKHIKRIHTQTDRDREERDTHAISLRGSPLFFCRSQFLHNHMTRRFQFIKLSTRDSCNALHRNVDEFRHS